MAKAKRVEKILVGRRKEEVASRAFNRVEKEYINKGNRLITITYVGDQIVYSGDQRSMRRLLKEQTTVDLLWDLMNDDGGEEEENQGYKYVTSKSVDIPPLFCQVSC